MKPFVGLVRGISGVLDKLAGVCFFSVMLLIISNIILRAVFNRPILGTYELVGFLTAMGISFALAHCAFQNCQIAVSFFVDRFSQKNQAVIEIFVNAAALIFWVMIVGYLVKLANNMMMKGLVSSSAEIPVYPFIYLIALGFLGLCLVLLFKLTDALKEVFGPAVLPELSWEPEVSDSMERAAR